MTRPRWHCRCNAAFVEIVRGTVRQAASLTPKDEGLRTEVCLQDNTAAASNPQGRAGQGPWQGRAGQGRAGQGRAGQGRARGCDL